ncbi:glycosyltransferase [Streptomyces sp. NPDC020742]|uniref:glycosyltransferase n=1 Tax=Streptomyces sp. NPDC020742 TaxID=3154897 RepID=UPI003410D7FB
MIETPPFPVDVVLPCLNEAQALPWVLDRIPPGWRAIVVDNGSTDGSPEIARSLGAYVVRAADADWRVHERDVPYRPRTGRSKVTGTWRGTWQTVRDMRAALVEQPAAGPAAAVPGGVR